MRTHHRSFTAAAAVLLGLLASPRAAAAQTASPELGTIQGRVAFGGGARPPCAAPSWRTPWCI